MKTKLYFAFMFLAILSGIFLATPSHARAGGGVSIGRSASVHVASPRAPVTIINNHRGGGGGLSSGAGGAFLGGAAGALVGNALSRPATPAYGHSVVPQPQVYGGGGEVVVMAPQPGAFDWFWSLITGVFKLVVLAAVACALRLGGMWVWNRHARTKRQAPSRAEFNPAAAFMAVQRAVGKKDLPALERLCTPGMYAALLTTEMTEETITNLNYYAVEGEDVYEFTFTCPDGRHRERWVFEDGALDGISVLY